MTVSPRLLVYNFLCFWHIICVLLCGYHNVTSIIGVMLRVNTHLVVRSNSNVHLLFRYFQVFLGR